MTALPEAFLTAIYGALAWTVIGAGALTASVVLIAGAITGMWRKP